MGLARSLYSDLESRAVRSAHPTIQIGKFVPHRASFIKSRLTGQGNVCWASTPHNELDVLWLTGPKSAKPSKKAHSGAGLLLLPPPLLCVNLGRFFVHLPSTFRDAVGPEAARPYLDQYAPAPGGLHWARNMSCGGGCGG
jgi:hypothetical protein